MKENVLKNKSFLFAIRIVNLSGFLTTNKKEFVIAKQILRSGTAIGALAREAEQAESKKDFVHKLQIVLKEANETEYWLELLFETKYIEKNIFESLQNDCKELLKILTAIINTTKKNFIN
jgi:four helix bundle protein